MMDSTRKPEPGEIIPVEGWLLDSPHGHCGTKKGERVVRLADLVRWLVHAREMSFASAVRAVCTPLEGDAPPLVHRLDPMEDAEPEDQASEWFKYLSGYDGLDSLPPQVAHARAAARDMKATWLMKPHDLARLVNSPGFLEFDEAKESPFEFSERADRTGGPRTLAVSFAVAHELWAGALWSRLWLVLFPFLLFRWLTGAHYWPIA